MVLPRERVIQGLVEELTGFEELTRSMSDADLAQPSRCDGWTVADVAAHVVGGMADIVGGRLDGLGTPEVTQRQVDERKGRSAAELADELRGVGKSAQDLLAVFDDEAWNGPAPGGFEFSLGEGIEALWYDAYLHADDMRAATGRSSVGGPGLEASVSHIVDTLQRQGWGPATLDLTGVPRFEVGRPGPDAPTVTADALEFVLVATGRRDAGSIGLDSSVNIYAG